MDHDFLTVVDGNDVVLGYSTKDDIKKRGLNCRCVQVFLFNADDELLVCKRPESKKVFPGKWSSVMGFVRRGESYEDAAIREVREEIGLDAKLKRVTKFSVMDGASRLFQEVYMGAVSDKVKPDKTEISEFKFLKIRDLRTEMVMGSGKYAPPFCEAVRAYMKARNIY
jgi:isopentenyldiphosphate isomerase